VPHEVFVATPLSYRIRKRRRPSNEVRRVLREQADLALRVLSGGPTPKGVHEARKACKRARAVLRLVREGVGDDAARQVEAAFRDAARAIGPVRDADVSRATLARLGRAGGVDVADREARGEAAVRGLEQARRLVDALDTKRVDQPVLVRALATSWGRARAAYRDACTEPTAERMHEWRKESKYLLFHLQLLQSVDPRWFLPLTRMLDDLQEQLGDHHDLSVLRQLVADDPVLSVGCSTRSAALEARTLALGSWLLAGRADGFGAWVEGLG